MGRDFLQLVSVPRPDGEGGEGDEVLVEYDVEWLSIVKSTHHLLSNTRGQRVNLPFETPRVERADMEAVRQALVARGLPGGPLVIPDNFQMTAPPESALNLQENGRTLELLPNPQTDEILSLLGLEHIVTMPSSAWESRYHGVDKPGAFSLLASSAATAEEPSFDESTGYPFEVDLVGAGKDPNEIELDG